jgi:hypothetical protein
MKGVQCEGVIQFYIGPVQVSAEEMGTWSPKRIEQFFQGVAAVVRAAQEPPKQEDRIGPPLLFNPRTRIV